MILIKHESYEEYVRVQIERSKRRTNYGRRVLSWIDEEGLSKVNELLHLYADGIKTMVCHGCRNGIEVNILQRLNPDTKVFGTDLYGRAYKYDRAYFRQIDFDKVPQEWLGYFDVVYSNCIDHSRDPINTLLAWKSELKENGICFVTFHWSKGEGNKADCFSLSYRRPLHEVGEISEKVGMKVLYTSEPYAVNNGRGHSANVILRSN